MNRKYTPLKTALALIGSASLVVAAHAATFTYSNGDLLMGFYSPNETTDYLIDLGSAATFRDATAPIVLSIGSTAKDLAVAFGPDWATRDDLYWGAFGSAYSANKSAVPLPDGDANNTLYATIAPGATPYLTGSFSTQATPASRISTMGLAAESDLVTANSSVATIQTSGVHPNEFQDNQAFGGALSFQYFANAMANFTDDGTSAAVLSLYRTATPAGGGGSAGSDGTLEGTFSITDTGVITFTPVPEPGTVALFALGGIFLLTSLRKRLLPSRG